jgi:nitronate monooxygenase
LAAAVSNAGGLGSIGIGAADSEAARVMIRAVRERTGRAFNVNVFCHAPAAPDHAREADWVARLAPEFARYGVTPPTRLREVYTSFVADPAAQEVLLAERPPVVSFHFGLPAPDVIDALRGAGIVLLATATNPKRRSWKPRGSTRSSSRGTKPAGTAACSTPLPPTTGSARSPLRG